MVAAGSETADWALNLRANPHCRATIGDARTATARRPSSRAPSGRPAVTSLILKYGTPAEELGRGPVFRLSQVGKRRVSDETEQSSESMSPPIGRSQTRRRPVRDHRLPADHRHPGRPAWPARSSPAQALEPLADRYLWAPHDVVREYLAAYQEGDFDRARRFVCEEIKSGRSARSIGAGRRSELVVGIRRGRVSVSAAGRPDRHLLRRHDRASASVAPRRCSSARKVAGGSARCSPAEPSRSDDGPETLTERRLKSRAARAPVPAGTVRAAAARSRRAGWLPADPVRAVGLHRAVDADGRLRADRR